MPQLCGVGLSETWLLEKCGDVHWTMICERIGALSHELKDSAGRRVYASFVATRISGSGLGGLTEGDMLHYESRLEHLNSTCSESLHRWDCGETSVVVEMLSVFLRRRDNWGNELTRVVIPGVTESLYGSHSDIQDRFRRQKRRPGSAQPILSGCTWQPTLTLDYNGAGLLYFARFHELVERGEVALLGESSEACYAVENRETYYFANMNPGEGVTVAFTDLLNTDQARRHQAEIRHASDGRLMSRVITSKKRAAMLSDAADSTPQLKRMAI
ncbi:MAG TPA: Pnap_2097 family protein [Bryobacteraceae bacterium]|nr:Pnap_2097 family protein [Bryobacteraceae bacterium]